MRNLGQRFLEAWREHFGGMSTEEFGQSLASRWAVQRAKKHAEVVRLAALRLAERAHTGQDGC